MAVCLAVWTQYERDWHPPIQTPTHPDTHPSRHHPSTHPPIQTPPIQTPPIQTPTHPNTQQRPRIARQKLLTSSKYMYVWQQWPPPNRVFFLLLNSWPLWAVSRITSGNGRPHQPTISSTLSWWSASMSVPIHHAQHDRLSTQLNSTWIYGRRWNTSLSASIYQN